MSESFPLQPLLDLANNRMDEAARKLGELIASEHAVEEKLALLVDYRKEYHARFVEAVQRHRPRRVAQFQRLPRQTR